MPNDIAKTISGWAAAQGYWAWASWVYQPRSDVWTGPRGGEGRGRCRGVL